MNIAKISAGKIGLLKMGAAMAVVAATLCAALPASADESLGQSANVGALRLGTFIPVDSNTTNIFGQYMWDVGLDWTFQQSGTSTRDLISVDYIQLGKNGNNYQVVPVTVGQQMLFSPHTGDIRPFVGYGIGIYNINLNNPGNPNFNNRSGQSATEFGGYVEAGYDLGKTWFVDARYHIADALKHTDPDGFGLTAGVRF